MLLPKVRHAALVPCRGEEYLALSLVFERPLERSERGLFLGELGNFAMEGCEVYEPRFPENSPIVQLHPAKGQGVLEESDYLDLLEHLGIRIKGNLPISTGQCLSEEENVIVVHHETSYVH